MSGMSDSTTCPNCNKSANRYSDHKPFDMVDITCFHCGFYTTTSIGYMDLGELNGMRKDSDMKPLKKLPKQEDI